MGVFFCYEKTRKHTHSHRSLFLVGPFLKEFPCNKNAQGHSHSHRSRFFPGSKMRGRPSAGSGASADLGGWRPGLARRTSKSMQEVWLRRSSTGCQMLATQINSLHWHTMGRWPEMRPERCYMYHWHAGLNLMFRCCSCKRYVLPWIGLGLCMLGPRWSIHDDLNF